MRLARLLVDLLSLIGIGTALWIAVNTAYTPGYVSCVADSPTPVAWVVLALVSLGAARISWLLIDDLLAGGR